MGQKSCQSTTAKTVNTTHDKDNIELQWLAGEQNTNTVHLQATGASRASASGLKLVSCETWTQWLEGEQHHFFHCLCFPFGIWMVDSLTEPSLWSSKWLVKEPACVTTSLVWYHCRLINSIYKLLGSKYILPQEQNYCLEQNLKYILRM